MNRFIVAALAIVATGCGVEKADSFRNGYPKSDAVTMKLPGSTGELRGDSKTRQELEGEKAAMYSLTRGVTYVVNGGAGFVLTLVKTIGDSTPTKVSETQAIWGPHTDALSPNTYKFTVTKNRTDDYSYQLEAKGKKEDDAKFRVILSGSHVVKGKDLGSGTFLLDWDAAATLPEHGDDIGTAEYAYAHETADAPVSIKATFRGVLDRDAKKPVDVDYVYEATEGKGGAFEFKMIKDLAKGVELENTAVKSRWEQSGAGRSDVVLSGGNLPVGGATFSECWDDTFASRYLVASFDPNAGWGSASACAFKDADYSKVAP